MQLPRTGTFNRYEIEAEIGRGAMGIVYKAHDPKINRTVAIKTISLAGRGSQEEKEFRERFVLEAIAAGSLSHPAIVTVYDVGEELESKNPFIVLEFVEGQSLDKVSSAVDGKCSTEFALSLVQELAEALDYAHGQGIVHRDIKPANILLTRDGRPKITDFGVAKLNTAYQTVAGQSLGTPAYMSPEQLNGDPVDGRSDLFSLGVILYTLLTGHRPFQGNSAMTVSFRVVHREPLPASAYDSNFPPDLDYVIGRAIAKDPALRYQTGKQMAEDLEDLRRGDAPRSKLGVNGVPTPRNTAAEAGTVCYSTSTRAARAKPSAALAKGTRWAAWEYAASAVLVLAVIAMAMAIFYPTTAKTLYILPARSSHVLPPPASKPLEPKVGNPVPQISPRDTPVTPALASTASARVVNTSSNAAAEEPARAPIRSDAAPFNSVKETTPSAPAAAPVAKPTSTLHIRVEHRFSSAEVRLWIDDKLAYKEDLDGETKRRMGIFKAVEGFKSDSLEIASGEHRIRARVQSADSSYDRTATISGSIPEQAERLLKIDCSNRKRIRLTLE